MTSQNRNKLTCNKCMTSLKGWHTDSISAQRKEAKAAGWWRTGTPVQDYCPDCAEIRKAEGRRVRNAFSNIRTVKQYHSPNSNYNRNS